MAWAQRIHATLFHHGIPSLADPRVRAMLHRSAGTGLSPAGAQAVTVALGRIDDLDAQITPLRRQSLDRPPPARLPRPARGALRRRHPPAAIIWAFLGDSRRFSSSAQAVRYTGLDVTVHASDTKRAAGHLSGQGPPILRWALFEADHHASPDHTYYTRVATRIDASRAALSVARKLTRRSHHILRRLGDQAWTPVPLTRLGWPAAPRFAQVLPVASGATSSAGPRLAAKARTPSGVVANTPARVTVPPCQIATCANSRCTSSPMHRLRACSIPFSLRGDT